MSVCLYVCMHACMYVCACSYIFIKTQEPCSIGSSDYEYGMEVR